MALLAKDVLLQRPSLPTEDVELPSFGGHVRLRAWTGADYDAFGTAVQAFKFDGAMYAAALAASAVNENGDRIFDLNGDLQKLAAACPKHDLEVVWAVVQRLNGLGKQGVEDAVKN
jgi:hypothetical protein